MGVAHAVWRETGLIERFADDSLLARLSELRSVSFLTLLDSEDTRLFVGVNDEGIVGLHFNAYRQ